MAAAALLAFGIATAGTPPEVLAEEAGAHEHGELLADAALSLTELVDLTLARYPSSVELTARREQADAWQNRGGGWMAGQPAITARYQTDRYGDDAGLQEIEAGIQLALWKWGQRSATRGLGTAYGAEADAAYLALRWEVAGLLRSVLWEIARAHAEFEVAQDSMAVAERLTATIERRYELGDVARSDVLLAQAALLDAESGAADAALALVDAERTYRSLSGLDRRPSFEAEALATGQAIGSDHPVLAFATTALERAQAEQQLARTSGSISPTLTVGPRRERSSFGQAYEDSIGLYVTVPFGGASYTRTKMSAAARDVAAARAARDQAVRQLDLQFHEASHGLGVARSNLALAEQRADLAGKGFAMGETAYSKGELGLIELLNLRAVYLDAQRQVVRFDIAVKRQTAMYNQALGVTP